nr:pentatricopeptide repeat-containing protein, mitochondrial [Quercus suber]
MVYLWKGTVGCVVLKGQLVRREGIEPNAIVYNPIIDALGESQRFKEAMRMLEQFLVLELGPTISTYNSLVARQEILQ